MKMNETKEQQRGALVNLLGAPTVLIMEEVVDNTLPATRYASMVELIGQLTLRRGQWVDRDEGLYWSNRSDVELLSVTAKPRDDGTHLCIVGDYGTMASFVLFALIFFGLFLAAAIGGFVFTPSSLVGVVIIGLVGLLVSLQISRVVWRQFALKKRAALEELLGELVVFVADGEQFQEP
jgi:hypothetical protein